MSRISPGVYAQWRAQSGTAQSLAEKSPAAPLTEQLLQLIWLYQRVRRDELHSTGRQPIRVLHPGFWNHESGPDFKNSVIQIGPSLAQNGDVEIDLSLHGWHAHGHDQNPAYRNVILHVVWEAEANGARSLPVLPLKPYLDAPLEELALWLRQEPGPTPVCLLGKCAAPLGEMEEDAVDELLRQAAQIRLETKARHLQACAKQVGWEQALWEGLFGALGYKNNISGLELLRRQFAVKSER